MLADLRLLRSTDEHSTKKFVLLIENEEGRKLYLDITNVQSAGALVSHIGLTVEQA